jgi:PAS domain S-box-containing protein
MRLLSEEFRYDHPTKGLIWLEAQGTPVHASDGSFVWHGYAQDVTERKRVEQELRASEARTRAFFDAGLLGVVYWNVDGAITDANDKFLDMLGYSREELAASRINWRDMTPPEFRPIDDAAISELRATGRNRRPFEKQYLRKNGTRLPVLIAAAVLDEERFRGVAFVLDISERKRAEKRMQKLQADRLDAAWRMATGLAHELNQPISAAATYLKAARRLSRMEPERRPASVEETMDHAAREMMRAGEIVNHIRSFVARGDPDMAFESLHDLVHEAIEAAAPSGNLKNARVRLELNAQSDRILADRVQIKQVLVNLIRNAIEAMIDSERKDVTISTSSIRSDMVRVDVADRGTGLSEHVKSDLFTAGLSTKATGMGFGLSISRSIIETHHGNIWADPNPGGGAIFSFTLPLVDQRSTEEPAVRAAE